MSPFRARVSLLCALGLSACIRLRNPNTDASITDGAIGDATIGDAAVLLDASDAMTAMDTGGTTDSSVTTDIAIDTGIVSDSSVIADASVIVDTGVRCPDFCGPAASLRDCGGPCMTDINEDPNHCGACGARCASGEYCLRGMCSAHEWITTSEFSTCAAISGRAYCWGQNLSQSVAAGGSNVASPSPVAMAASMDRTFMIAHGREATAAIAALASEPTDVGNAFYWGSMNTIDGMTAATTATPARLPSVFEQFVEVSAARSIAQFCARTRDRRVYCWGRDDLGGLARPPAIAMGSVARQPQEVAALNGAVELSMGDRFGCARMCGGRVLCWGTNEDHQLGRSTGAELYDSTPAPVLLAGGAPLDDAISIAAGFNHACAVRANGTVVCWGANQCGQLGDGSAVTSDCVYNALGDQAADSVVPNTVRAVGGAGMLTGALSVSVGQSTSCAIVRSGGAGVLHCWGANHYQQIRSLPELGNWTTAPLEVRLGAGESVVQASVGYGHVCARLASGAVRCWGRGNFGQLGASAGDAGATPFGSTRDR